MSCQHQSKNEHTLNQLKSTLLLDQNSHGYSQDTSDAYVEPKQQYQSRRLLMISLSHDIEVTQTIHLRVEFYFVISNIFKHDLYKYCISMMRLIMISSCCHLLIQLHCLCMDQRGLRDLLQCQRIHILQKIHAMKCIQNGSHKSSIFLFEIMIQHITVPNSLK